ncbi:MAG: GTP cyclohydrolase II [Flavobacteriales bacterium]|nr:GTP cyclohydrolase II [Flavobacteriales bacterium]
MKPLVTASLPALSGNFEILAFESGVESQPHLVLRADRATSTMPLVRIHSECWTGDVVGSLKCDCGPQLNKSLEMIAREGGAVVYLRQEGRGIGLIEKLKAYNLQDEGMDTFEANEALGHQRDGRDFGVAGDILKSLGWTDIRLLTNNPEKVDNLNKAGIKVVEVIPLEIEANPHNEAYLRAKSKAGQFRIP